MKGRIWLLLGAVLGIAIALGKVPYLNGAASSFAETALRVVNTAGLTLAHDSASHGAPRRVVEGFTAVLAVVVPGFTALLLVYAARATLYLRALIGLALGALGVAAFFYLGHASAAGVAALALAAAGIVVAATGPVVAAPLVALGALIATAYLPRLLDEHSTLPNVPVSELHEALFATASSPLWLRIAVLVVATVPFVFAARLVVR